MSYKTACFWYTKRLPQRVVSIHFSRIRKALFFTLFPLYPPTCFSLFLLFTLCWKIITLMLADLCSMSEKNMGNNSLVYNSLNFSVHEASFCVGLGRQSVTGRALGVCFNLFPRFYKDGATYWICRDEQVFVFTEFLRKLFSAHFVCPLGSTSHYPVWLYLLLAAQCH